jgi:hypothetical protein
MVRTATLLLAAVCAPAVSPAHEFFSTKITWSREISRIVYKSCAGCHREGGAAFSLLTFEEARPWATAIKEEVLSRRMPPWGAAKGFGTFQDDRGLSQDEISLISNWVEGGAPEGQKIYLPPNPPLAAAPRPATPKFRELALPRVPLPNRLTVAGIRSPIPVRAGAKITVELPDGSTEPLIWIVEPGAASKRVFLFREQRSFPAGSRFTVSQPGGLWKLLLPASNLAAR